MNRRHPLYGGPADQPTSNLRLIAGTRLGEDVDANQLTGAAGEASQSTASPASAASVEPWSIDGIREAQKRDPDISFIYDLVASNVEKPCWNDVSSRSKDTKVLWSFYPRLAIRDGLLKRDSTLLTVKTRTGKLFVRKSFGPRSSTLYTLV